MAKTPRLNSFPKSILGAQLEIANLSKLVTQLDLQMRAIEVPMIEQVCADTTLKNQASRDAGLDKLRFADHNWQDLNSRVVAARYDVAVAKAELEMISAQYAIAKINARTRIAELQLRSSLGLTEDVAIDDKVLTSA